MNRSLQAKLFSGFHCVGWVKSAHGIRGELYVQLYAKKADWLSALNKVYLLPFNGQELKEWTVDFSRPHKEGLILKLNGVSDRNVSETMRKSGVYISEVLLEAETGEAIFLKQILNFEVYDTFDNPLGKIVSFATNGVQDLLCVQTPSGQEALVPFVDDFIVHIDFDKHTVKMDLPQGLFNLEE